VGRVEVGESGGTAVRERTWIGLLLVCLSGCYPVAALREFSVCTPAAAAQAGTKDARRGRTLNEGYADICGVAESSLNKLYREAYDGVPAEERAAGGFFKRIFRLGRG
jgi:hypothetical protein